MSEGNAYILTNMMQSVIDEGTGRRLSESKITLAGKTGTTGDEDGNRDAWMAAYNPEYAAAVWIGYDDASIGRLPTTATGGSYPAGILSKVFEKLYETREKPDFVMPQEVIEVRLDQYSMEQSYMSVLANALTPPDQIRKEVFVKGTEPTVSSSYWVVPSPPNIFSVEIGASGYPTIRFIPEQDFVLYRLYRESGQGSTPALLKEWSNSLGEVLYEDTGAAHGQRHTYYIIPVHPQLKIGERQVVGPSTAHRQVEMPSLPFMYQNR
jgi:hypothetical protein